MSRLTDLIASTKAKDPRLGTDLEREFKALSSRLSFGLNFERHQPEAVELPHRTVRRGDKVRILSPRGSIIKGDGKLWLVEEINKTKKQAKLKLLDLDKNETCSTAIDDLVVVSEFRDEIYPGLISTGSISRGGNKPWHTVINGENYHVLKTLTWTHRGKIDVIYIDPPYNTGAKDWKYNNDYVESDDLYRHSKWLAMMERRLLLAKQLLNPYDSVLIVTIDEKEYMRLGLLLEQVFQDARIQMVSTVINPAGSSRPSSFARTDEYLFFVQIGKSSVASLPLGDEWRVNPTDTRTTHMMWSMLKRTGTGKNRADSPRLFYPIFVKKSSGKIVNVGSSLPLRIKRSTIKSPKGQVVCFPTNDDGSDGRWQLSQSALLEAVKKGYVRVGRPSALQGYTISYLKAGEQKKVEAGIYKISGRREDGSLLSDTEHRQIIPGSAWRIPSHDASRNGSNLLRELIPGRKFPFPKSLYAVEDAIRFFVSQKPNALILDFFAGSGTTAHATLRLNKQDDGKRQCISVTNNEVAAEEQRMLRENGLRPGDIKWEEQGICEFITKPRIKSAISGKTPEGDDLKEEYKFLDKFPMAEGFRENAEFFTLTYETPIAVSYQTAFARIAPLLWFRSGCVGNKIEKIPISGWELAETYSLLTRLDKASEFIKAVRKASNLRISYIVTDDEQRFQAIARSLPKSVEAVRLYESYLTNFAFSNGEDA